MLMLISCDIFEQQKRCKQVPHLSFIAFIEIHKKHFIQKGLNITNLSQCVLPSCSLLNCTKSFALFQVPIKDQEWGLEPLPSVGESCISQIQIAFHAPFHCVFCGISSMFHHVTLRILPEIVTKHFFECNLFLPPHDILHFVCFQTTPS